MVERYTVQLEDNHFDENGYITKFGLSRLFIYEAVDMFFNVDKKIARFDFMLLTLYDAYSKTETGW